MLVDETISKRPETGNTTLAKWRHKTEAQLKNLVYHNSLRFNLTLFLADLLKLIF